ncbi:MAG TPA: enoyl-CoA hydratase/isomerase family protein [Hyphomicrobiaceae bacterium]|nr:enoyl-CoA hydratase/isomerase family protein [Hyphomicrobiaceae bacterium]
MSNSNERAILTDVTGGIATVTLNKPWKLNAWDTPMRAEVAEVLRGWNGDPRVCAIVMTGAGERAFSAGQDLDETEKFQSGHDGANWFQSWRDFYNSIRDLDKPCLAALNGVAAGSAFQAAMLTDVRVGHPGVRMGQAEINSGIPSVTGPMLMLPRIGLSRTVELTLTGRMMEAEECRAIGLIHYLVERPDQVMGKTRELAEMMAAKPAIAMRLTKARLRQVTQAAFDEAFANGGAYQAEAFASGEPQAAMRVFFAERARRRKARAEALRRD